MSLGSLPITSTGDRRASPATIRHKGKAPTVDSFTGMDPELWLDDWIPALLRASKWYS